jgi:hypothetical protein
LISEAISRSYFHFEWGSTSVLIHTIGDTIRHAGGHDSNYVGAEFNTDGEIYATRPHLVPKRA